jgi:alpha-tubulin suppressor-like RCC1 family protein
MRRATLPIRLTGTAALVLLAACADDAVVAPPPVDAPAPLTLLSCVANVRDQSVRCEPATPALGSVRGNLILGGQGTYVRLANSGTSYNSTTQIFRTDVTVQNLLGQPIGTTDGTTVDPDGIMVFFAEGPEATVGTGPVDVANEDGNAVFLGAQQPFFRYVERLTTEQTSAAHEWRFSVPTNVTEFTFGVYVSAAVPDESALMDIDLDPRTLAVGGFHSCALTSAGQAYCWGTNDDEQLGRGDPEAGADSVPVPVAGGHSWRVLTAGRFHTCGITTENAAYCWGDNQTGQLGYGGDEDSATPVAVTGGLSWRQLDAGAGHTCGVTNSNEAFCWGDGTAGQLGAADSASSGTPVAVFGGRRWATVDAGLDHSCGVTQGGAAYCWGDDTAGELGRGIGPSTARPVLVAGNHSWRSISAGDSYACGVTSLDAAMCWGSDSSGQLGNGAAPATDVPDEVEGGMEWMRVSTGSETSCGITTGGAAYCWGFNNTREIGDGTTTPRDVPTAVLGGQLWVSIDGGDYHTCGVNQSGVARCWGYNEFGQLGDNTTDNNPFPVIVAGGHTWAQ